MNIDITYRHKSKYQTIYKHTYSCFFGVAKLYSWLLEVANLDVWLLFFLLARLAVSQLFFVTPMLIVCILFLFEVNVKNGTIITEIKIMHNTAKIG